MKKKIIPRGVHHYYKPIELEEGDDTIIQGEGMDGTRIVFDPEP